ncbi:MAG: peptide deformylase [Candidatus Pacebacteria bacterium]|nr:peptide deformylase [Candidatus Paceibacterota bacterium]
MKIFTINNKKEEKFLRQKTRDFDFSEHNKKEIRDLLQQMREIMKRENGIGLSANQVGLDMKVFVAKVGEKAYAVFNPKITKLSKETSVLEEGCLSVPGFFGPVERPEKITMEGKDNNGKKIKIKAWGLLARVFQHETDHLNGILFIDKAKKIYQIEDESKATYK